MAIILPSIASANPLCYAEEVRRLGTVPHLHFDIEDGNFIPNITFGMKTVRAVSSISKAEKDAHLMTTNPMEYIDPLHEAGMQAICFQIESALYPLQALNKIKKLGMKAGLAVNLKTPLEQLRMFLGNIDYLLVMTSEADYGNQDFHPLAVERVKQAKEMLYPGTQLWVDGGVGLDQLRLLVQAGIDAAVMGRAVFQSPDPEAAVYQMEQIC